METGTALCTSLSRTLHYCTVHSIYSRSAEGNKCGWVEQFNSWNLHGRQLKSFILIVQIHRILNEWKTTWGLCETGQFTSSQLHYCLRYLVQIQHCMHQVILKFSKHKPFKLLVISQSAFGKVCQIWYNPLIQTSLHHLEDNINN